MKATVKIEQEIEIASIRIYVAVRYGEEDIPNDFPMRKGDAWHAEVEMDTGIIKDWPAGRTGKMHMKVCDCGSYALLDLNRKTLATLESAYVPHGVVPGEYGDYIILDIDATGRITNWPDGPDVSAFFDCE